MGTADPDSGCDTFLFISGTSVRCLQVIRRENAKLFMSFTASDAVPVVRCLGHFEFIMSKETIHLNNARTIWMLCSWVAYAK